MLHGRLIVGDWHADTLLWKRDIANRYEYGHIDIPRLQQGNVGLQMFTTVTKSPSGLNYERNSSESWDDITSVAVVSLWPVKTWNSLTERALHQARKLDEFVAENPSDIHWVRNQQELKLWQQRRVKETKLIGALLGTEGSHALDGKLENIDKLYEAGFRMMSLQHFFDNKLGGSLHGLSNAGLSEFGRKTIQRFAELGIILDVSHSSHQVVEDVLAVYKKPVVVSHTGFRGQCNTRRNIPDELMRKIAENGGLIAVGLWPDVVCGDNVKAVVEAISYGLELVGEDHLSLGSDYDGSVAAIIDSSELAALTHAMLESGITQSQIEKVMGGNMLRFLQEHLPEQ